MPSISKDTAGSSAEITPSNSPAVKANFDEVIEIAKKGLRDPEAAWEAIATMAERGLASHAARPKPEGEGARTAEDSRSSPVEADIGAGGPMPINLTTPARDRRPFVGFDREHEVYLRRKPELLTQFAGRHVVIVGDAVLGPFDSPQEAQREGYARFGLGPVYIRRVIAEEPTVEATRFLAP